MTDLAEPAKPTEGRRPRISDTLRAGTLPPPPFAKALTFGGLVALLGAAAWAGLAYFAHLELGYLAWGIGAAVGWAVVFGGGHGTLLAVSAALLSVLSIGTGKHLTFQIVVADQVAQEWTPAAVAAMRDDAAAWHAIDRSNDEAVEQFALERRFAIGDAPQFRAKVAPDLEWLHTTKPSLEEVHARYAADYSFVEYLREDFHPFDVLFLALGIATAAGFVSRHTTNKSAEAVARARQERDAAAASAEPGHAKGG
jgi:hypothetical protein